MSLFAYETKAPEFVVVIRDNGEQWIIPRKNIDSVEAKGFDGKKHKTFWVCFHAGESTYNFKLTSEGYERLINQLGFELK